MIHYLPYTQSDLEQVYLLRLKMYTEVFRESLGRRAPTLEQLNKLLATDPECSWTVWDDANLIGFINADTGHYLGTKVAYLNLMGVEKPYRKAGVGRRLFELVEKSSRAQGCTHNYCEAMLGVGGPIAFYLRIGWQQQREFRCLELDTSVYKRSGETLPADWQVHMLRAYEASRYSHILEQPNAWLYRPEEIDKSVYEKVVVELHDAQGCFAFGAAFPSRGIIIRIEAAREHARAYKTLLDKLISLMFTRRVHFYNLDTRKVYLNHLLDQSGFLNKLSLAELSKEI